MKQSDEPQDKIYQNHIAMISAQVVWPVGYNWHRNTAKPTQSQKQGWKSPTVLTIIYILPEKTITSCRKGQGGSFSLLSGWHEQKCTLWSFKSAMLSVSPPSNFNQDWPYFLASSMALKLFLSPKYFHLFSIQIHASRKQCLQRGSYLLFCWQGNFLESLVDYTCLPFDSCVSWMAAMCFSFLVNLTAMILAFNRYRVFVLLVFNRALKHKHFFMCFWVHQHAETKLLYDQQSHSALSIFKSLQTHEFMLSLPCKAIKFTNDSPHFWGRKLRNEKLQVAGAKTSHINR